MALGCDRPLLSAVSQAQNLSFRSHLSAQVLYVHAVCKLLIKSEILGLFKCLASHIVYYCSKENASTNFGFLAISIKRPVYKAAGNES